MKRIAIFGLALAMLTSCENAKYDAGDSQYSYLRADFVEAHTAAAKEFVSARTDDGDTLIFSPHVMKDWASTPDSTYRCLLYYNKVNEDRTTDIYSISRIPVASWHHRDEMDTIATDPITFESAWISGNRKYLNVGFYVKTGKQDDNDNLQTLSVLYDTCVAYPNGTRKLYLQVLHNQNGVPEYYSSHNYFSVPLVDMKEGDIIHLSMNTYGSGWIAKEIKY